jgi:hypothetical protein
VSRHGVVLAGVLAAGLTAGPGVSAQQQEAAVRAGALAAKRAPSIAVKRTVVRGGIRAGRVVAGPRAMFITGYAWTANQAPIPNAMVRVRNILTGFVESTTRADAAGRFVVEGLEGGNYVVELIDQAGRVLAVGETFSAFPGDAVVTFVRLADQLPAGVANVFRNAAASVISSAASVGVTAVAPVAEAETAESETSPIPISPRL